MSESNKTSKTASSEGIQEINLQRMEAILNQSAHGIHVLFDNNSIAQAMGVMKDNRDFFNYEKMKRVQDVMTALIEKKSYMDKVAYLKELDEDSYHMLIRTYFHIVENTVRSNTDLHH